MVYIFEINKIYNEDCFCTMNKMRENNFKVDLILTSPHYNTGRKRKPNKCLETMMTRYDYDIDSKTSEEYIVWTIDLFNTYDKILKDNSVVLYNLSYSSGSTKEDVDNIGLFYKVLYNIIENTNFCIVDKIVWKKKSALPNNTSSNKLTRIVEDVFVICRKNEINTFFSNKKVVKIREDNNQKYYENIFNFIEAKNNDGKCNLNKAAYSSELCEKLLNIYSQPNSIVYDSFIGTGTTAVACKKLGYSFIGSELSEAQCEFANKRIGEIDQ